MGRKQKIVSRGLLACGVALTALAQAAVASADDKTTEVKEVVVTANKRIENVQTVAGGVGVQTGEQLQTRKLEQLTDYAAYIPGFYVNSGGAPGQAQVALRGISSVSAGAAIGTYIDETPMGSSSNWNHGADQTLDLLPYDLDRLEVLSGPQGTLYGAGSMGGLIKYVLLPANTSAFEAKAGAETFAIDGAGSPGFTVQGMVNAPIIQDVLAVRLSVFDKSSPGYTDNVALGQDHTNKDQQYGGRFALTWRPTADLSVKINALDYRISADDLGEESFAGSNIVPTTNGAYIIQPTGSYGDLKQSHAFPQIFRKDVTYLSSTVDWNPGSVDLISATSWSRTRSHFTFDDTPDAAFLLSLYGFPNSKVNFLGDVGLDKFTQEFRLTSPEDKNVSWILGAYYGYERASDNQYDIAYNAAYQPIAAFAPYAFEAHLPTTFEEIAVFGDLTWKITDQFDITGGLRYAYNRQKFSVSSDGAFAPSTGNQSPPPSDESVTTWMVNARYHLSPYDMLYVRVATGYRPGSPNSPLPHIPQTVGADTLINYEVGWKSKLLDNRATVDLSAFYIDWSRIQLLAALGPYTYLANGGHAVSKGLEFASTLTPAAGLTFGLNAAYTDSALDSVIAGAPFLTGYQLPGVPKFSVSVTADYNWEMSDGWFGHVGGGYRWLDKEWLMPVETLSAGSAAVQAPSYSVLDLNASLRKNNITFKIYGKNLGDVRAFQGSTIHTDVATGLANQVDMNIIQPRTIGVGVDVAF
jgi:outer membrane receptor protein involved in Fe transport